MRSIVCSDRSWFSLIALLVALSLTLVACDSGGGNGGDGNDDESFPEPPGRPGFTSTVTGAWQASLSGAAVHTADGATAGRASAVVIRLSSEEAPESVIMLAAEGPIRSGRYAIQPAGSSGVTAHIQGPAREGSWKGASGALQIVRVDGSSIVGQFRVVAQGPHGESLTASGAFETAAVQ